MLKIGLTGGIGSGKSTVAKLFEDLGIPVIDADVIAHQLVELGQPALVSIAKQFGKNILTQSGSLNRERLREIIYSNATQKKNLEAILHPLVYDQIQYQIDSLSSPYCLICIPLLVETQMEHFVDRILVIDCSVEDQFSRVKNRDRLSDNRINSIIASQASRNDRLAVADDIIDNANGTQVLAEQVKKLHNLYMSSI